jgi:Na+-transporting methylmalonyl-CoA/oxaloacetate decarboxylase gamma subunit
VLDATWFVLAGMGIVFLTLGVLVLVVSLLGRWLSSRA